MTLALENLPDDVAALKAIILAARAETAVLTTTNVQLEAENAAFTG